MNDSLTHQKRLSKDLSNLCQKKKAIPISINTNPNPGQFLFKNNLSNIATSYKDISEKIQNLEKSKLMLKNKGSNNPRVFNNFLSVNSKASQLSNQSSVSKNTSNIISQRILPAKNLSSTSFSKGILLNVLNATKQKMANTNRNYLQAKTEHSLISFTKEKDSKKAANCKGKGLIKKNIIRQKSIGVLPSSGNNLKIEYGYQDNERKDCKTMKHSKVTLSNIDDHLKKIKHIKTKISKIKYNFKNFIQITKQPKKSKEKTKEKQKNLTSTTNNYCYSTNSNNPRKKRGLSHDLGNKTKPKPNNSHGNIQIKGTLPKNNRAISINQISFNAFQSTVINPSQIEDKSEVIINKQQPAQGKIPHQPIQVHVQTLINNNKKTQHNRTINKHPTHELIGLEIVEDDENERLLSENNYHNEERNNNNNNNIFDCLLMAEEDGEEDKFDDLNSIVRIIDFKSVPLRDGNLFNTNNALYQKFEKKFSSDFDTSCNKNKCSERKKMNMSVSTQDNSYKKSISPFQ